MRSDNGCAILHVVTHEFLTALAWDHSQGSPRRICSGQNWTWTGFLQLLLLLIIICNEFGFDRPVSTYYYSLRTLRGLVFIPQILQEWLLVLIPLISGDWTTGPAEASVPQRYGSSLTYENSGKWEEQAVLTLPGTKQVKTWKHSATILV